MLIGHHIRSQNCSFYEYGDSEEAFIENCKIQPENWYWRNTPIRYSLNSDGYRCPEWDQIDWANSILMFGCSYIFGTGVDDRQTIPSQLSLRFKRPVINLGIPGTSPMYQFMNTITLREQGIVPKAVIYSWPKSSRCTVVRYEDPLSVDNVIVGHNIKAPLFTDVHNWTYLQYLMKTTDLLWSCPVFHLHCDLHNWDKDPNLLFVNQSLDFARDLIHPGPRSLRYTSFRIHKISKDSLGL